VANAATPLAVLGGGDHLIWEFVASGQPWGSSATGRVVVCTEMGYQWFEP